MRFLRGIQPEINLCPLRANCSTVVLLITIKSSADESDELVGISRSVRYAFWFYHILLLYGIEAVLLYLCTTVHGAVVFSTGEGEVGLYNIIQPPFGHAIFV